MVLEVDSRVDSGSILDHIWTQSEEPHKTAEFDLHLAVGRALRLEYTNIRVLEVYWVGTGIAPPHPPGHPIPRVHPSPPGITQAHRTAVSGTEEYGRGAQIRRPTHFK